MWGDATRLVLGMEDLLRDGDTIHAARCAVRTGRTVRTTDVQMYVG